MAKNSKRETNIDEEIDLEDVTYQEIINKINEIYNYITLEINKQIKQVQILTDEERWKREKARREAQIISFRGAQIPRNEADFLQKIEIQLNKNFNKVEEVEDTTELGFSVENNRIIGIGLYSCGLTNLPKSVGKVLSLEILGLSRNKLKTLPESIGNLQSLQILALIYNQLIKLPDSIGKLSSLEMLFLIGNKLSIIPESIGNLTSLQDLYLRGNQLTTLPESIGNLSSLQYLDLKDNQLTALPESIGNLKSLKTLDLRDNKLILKKIKFLKNLEQKGVRIYK